MGLKINYHKSELFYFGNAQDHLDQYVELFGCKSGDFPIRYSRIPIHFGKLRNAEWRKVEERFERRLGSWKGKHLSIGPVLSSLPMYMMSFALPKGVQKKLDYFLSRFYWHGDEQKNIV